MQTATPNAETLSPWWKHAVILTLIGGFAVLMWLATRAYSDAPPIPETVQGPSGETLFTKADIVQGQHVFLKYGLMDNGSIWGRGVLQLMDVLKHGYWHARSEAFLNQRLFVTREWLRLPGDLVFITLGVVPMVMAALWCYLETRPDGKRPQISESSAT